MLPFQSRLASLFGLVRAEQRHPDRKQDTRGGGESAKSPEPGTEPPLAQRGTGLSNLFEREDNWWIGGGCRRFHENFPHQVGDTLKFRVGLELGLDGSTLLVGDLAGEISAKGQAIHIAPEPPLCVSIFAKLGGYFLPARAGNFGRFRKITCILRTGDMRRMKMVRMSHAGQPRMGKVSLFLP